MTTCYLQSLPAELIDGILAHLCPEAIARVSGASKLLRNHALKDSVWQSFLERDLPEVPAPRLGTYRDLYLAHHPHWFLTRHRIWFSDRGLQGNLLYARYDHARGCIEAYSIAAQRGPRHHGWLNWDGKQVLYDTFNPTVLLDLNQPKLRLDSRSFRHAPNQFSPECFMETKSQQSHQRRTVFVHTRPLAPEVASEPSVQLWPPRILPGTERVRNTSSDGFHPADHLPKSSDQVGQKSFRVREWMEFSSTPMLPIRVFGQRRNEEIVSTYATLPREAYTPTAEKPWQGIWCGDYKSHGVEFLAIMQPDDPLPLPQKAKRAFDRWPNITAEDVETLLYGQYEDDDFDGVAENLGQNYSNVTSMVGSGLENDQDAVEEAQNSDRAPYKGRLEAVKLTGDPNVPRGEYTFIVDDLGEKGLVKHTTESVFEDESTSLGDDNGLPAGPFTKKSKVGSTCLPNRLNEGARVVRSVGHAARTGFVHDGYIPTQLVLVSENTIAQYWKPFSHVSFYKRVDLDALERF